MDKEKVTIKIWRDTRKLLNVVRAETEESQVELIDRLLRAELHEVDYKAQKADALSILE